MSLSSINDLPIEEVEAQTQIYFKALQGGRRGREDLEALRKVMQLCLGREGYSLTLLPYAPLMYAEVLSISIYLLQTTTCFYVFMFYFICNSLISSLSLSSSLLLIS
jgi:hypothetical protein